jgi:hypothetical protein
VTGHDERDRRVSVDREPAAPPGTPFGTMPRRGNPPADEVDALHRAPERRHSKTMSAVAAVGGGPASSCGAHFTTAAAVNFQAGNAHAGAPSFEDLTPPRIN